VCSPKHFSKRSSDLSSKIITIYWCLCYSIQLFFMLHSVLAEYLFYRRTDCHETFFLGLDKLDDITSCLIPFGFWCSKTSAQDKIRSMTKKQSDVLRRQLYLYLQIRTQNLQTHYVHISKQLSDISRFIIRAYCTEGIEQRAHCALSLCDT